MRIVLITQARMNSTRLPEKIMLPVMGKPLLSYHLDRLKMASLADEVIVATVDEEACDPIEGLASSHGIRVYRGSETDVLDRYYQAAKQAQADAVVRVTSDCPLIDAQLIDKLIIHWQTIGANQYCALDIGEYSRGFDAELFPISYLEQAWEFANEQADREHVTRYMYTNPEQFKIGTMGHNGEPAGHYRFCVDTLEDFELVKRILETLWPKNPQFSWLDVVDLMRKNHDWFLLNAQVEQKLC